MVEERFTKWEGTSARQKNYRTIFSSSDLLLTMHLILKNSKNKSGWASPPKKWGAGPMRHPRFRHPCYYHKSSQHGKVCKLKLIHTEFRIILSVDGEMP